MRRSRPLVASACALAALTAGGCGQSDDRATVRSTTERFLAAYKADEGDTACAALSQDTRKELESQEKKSCAEAIGDVELKEGAVDRVEVDITNAKVDLDSGETVFLSEEAVGWRIAAVGCKPEGEPRKRPMDCELQA